ncbi:Acetyl-coenzyme A synthetase [compost metagenome]
MRAFVVPRSDAAPGPALADEIRGFVGERLAWYQAPREIVFVDELPLTATGKIIRRELRERRETGPETSLPES